MRKHHWTYARRQPIQVKNTFPSQQASASVIHQLPPNHEKVSSSQFIIFYQLRLQSYFKKKNDCQTSKQEISVNVRIRGVQKGEYTDDVQIIHFDL